jgi:hypothetical protein
MRLPVLLLILFIISSHQELTQGREQDHLSVNLEQWNQKKLYKIIDQLVLQKFISASEGKKLKSQSHQITPRQWQKMRELQKEYFHSFSQVQQPQNSFNNLQFYRTHHHTNKESIHQREQFLEDDFDEEAYQKMAQEVESVLLSPSP